MEIESGLSNYYNKDNQIQEEKQEIQIIMLLITSKLSLVLIWYKTGI